MWRADCWVPRARGLHWWVLGISLLVVLTGGWAQGSGAPIVTFLEPSDGSTLPTDLDTLSIRFRLISPDNTNLMRYQPFVNGLPGNDPIPIDPPRPQVELTILWRGVKQFPDGVHTITIKVVDAKGREGSGTLTLYKGRDLTKPTAEILQPRSGEMVRGKVPILVRVSDDRGVRGITVSATQRETARTQTIYMTVGNFGRLMEVRVMWDTTSKHPETGEDLFPDGIYLLQARVQDQERNEGVSSEVLVIVQNRIAQPLISQEPTGQTIRGGALPPIVPAESPTGQAATLVVPSEQEAKPSSVALRLALPSPEGTPAVAESLLLTLPAQTLGQVATANVVPQTRLTLALPKTEGTVHRLGEATVAPRSDLPLPQPVGTVAAVKRLAPHLPSGEGTPARLGRTPQPTMPLTATPQWAPIRHAAIVPPTGQERLYVAWVLPSPRTLRRTVEELPQEPMAVAPVPTPRLPASSQVTQPKAPRPSQAPIVQSAHSFRYTVIAGDTLFNLAQRFGLSIKELAAANGLPENAPLRIGQRLIIPARPVSVLVDGKVAECETPAFVRQGVAVGSLRAVVEASGGTVGWSHERKQATANLGPISLTATIGRNTLEVNGESVPLSLAPFLMSNRTFLPLRPLGNALGKTVIWEKGTVRMESPK